MGPDVLTERVVTPASEAFGLLLNTPGQEGSDDKIDLEQKIKEA